MSMVRLISPSFFSTKQQILQAISEAPANLIVLPTYNPSLSHMSNDYVFEYPSVEEIQAVLHKGQKVYCQQMRAGHAPKHVLVSRKDVDSLGRECSIEEITQQGDKFIKRINKKRVVNVRGHQVSFVFDDEIQALSADLYSGLQANLLICPSQVRPTSWTKLSKTIKAMSEHTSVAFVSLNDSDNAKTLSKIKTSTKLFNQGVENTDAATWDSAKKLFCVDIPLDD